MIIYSSKYRFDPVEDGYEVPGVSETEPGQSMSIKELITRMARGERPQIAMRNEYDYEESYEGFDCDPTSDPNYDLADYTADSLRLGDLASSGRNTSDHMEAHSSKNDEIVANESFDQGDSVDSPRTPA